MNNIPADRLLMQPFSYTANNPPVMFVIPGAEQAMTAAVIAGMATEFGAKAQYNNIRTFAFNYFSQNNWNNSQFMEVCYTAAMILMGRMRAGENFNMIFSQSISDIATMYTSSCVLQFQHLMQYCNQENYNAALANANQLVQIKQNMQNMQGTITSGMQHPQVLNQQPQYNTGMVVNQSPNLGTVNAQTQTFGTNQVCAGGYVEPDAEVSRFAAMNKNRQAAQPQYAPPVAPAAPVLHTPHKADPKEVKPTQEMLMKKWKPTVSQPCLPLMNIGAKGRFGVCVDEIIYMPIIEDFEEIMDREQHRILGGSVVVCPTERADTIIGDINAIASFNPTVAAKAVDAPDEVKDTGVSVYIKPSHTVVLSIEELITGVRAYKHTNPESKHLEVCRGYGYVSTALFMTKPLELFDGKEFDNLEDIATAMINCASDLAIKLPKESDESKAFELETQIQFLNALNEFLTDVVNDISLHKLSTSLKISSFTDDVLQLAVAIEESYGEVFRNAFDRISKEYGKMVLSALPDSTARSLVLNEEDTSTTLSFIYVPYSVTLVDMMSSELGFKIEDNKSYMITEKQPWLLRLAESLFRQHSNLVDPTLYDVIVTTDNKVFKLHKGLVGRDSYLISL